MYAKERQMTKEIPAARELRWALNELSNIRVITANSNKGIGKKVHDLTKTTLILTDACKNSDIEENLARALKVLHQIVEMTQEGKGIGGKIYFSANSALTHIAISQVARQAL